MTNKKKVNVVKIPLGKKQTDLPTKFPVLPQLYLEIIENKSKIKQDLINKEYVPGLFGKEEYDKENNYPQEQEKQSEHKKKKRRKRKIYHSSDIDSSDEDSNKKDSPDSSDSNSINEEFEKRLNKLLNTPDSDEDSDEKSQKNDSVEVSKSSDNELYIDENVENERTEDEDELSAKLKRFLNDTDSDSVSVRHSDSRGDKYSVQRNKYGMRSASASSERVVGTPPTLADLEKRGIYKSKKELRDINNIPMAEHDIENQKRELLFKIELLKKSYPNVEIESFNIHSEYETIDTAYKSTVRLLSVDNSVETYRKFLTVGFAACEFGLGFLNLDMEGFTQQQMVNMSSYDSLLIELGEKSYVPDGSKYPVELRLMGMIIMNAAFFLMTKMFMKKSGSALSGIFNNLNTPKKPTVAKKKMKGPNLDGINLDE